MSLNLDKLRTPVPLHDADYAAVRARVMSKIRERRGIHWSVRLLAAAACALAIFTTMLPREIEGPLTVKRAELKSSVPAAPLTRPSATLSAPRGERARVRGVARHSDPTRFTTIQLQTADPDIRIIWIVNPKEES